MSSAPSAYLVIAVVVGILLTTSAWPNGAPETELGPTSATAFFPQTFLRNSSIPFSIPSGFGEPNYQYYVAVDARMPSTVRVVADAGGVLEKWEVAGEHVSLVRFKEAGEYRIEASGEGTVLVFAMPFSLQNTGTFRGNLPGGLFSVGFSRGIWGGHPRVEIGLTATGLVTTYLFVLHDELALAARTEAGTSATFVREVSRFDTFYFLVFDNPQAEPVEASIYVLGSGEWPPAPGTLAFIVLFAAGVSLAVFFAWRLRRRSVARP